MSCRNQRDCAGCRERECPNRRDRECGSAVDIDRRDCECPNAIDIDRRDCGCAGSGVEQSSCPLQQDFASLRERERDRDRDCDDTRERLLKRVQRYGFMTDDLRLYLNTHPESQEALCALKRYLELKREAKEEYEQRYGPLTLEAMEERCRYDWIESPWPWEKEV